MNAKYTFFILQQFRTGVITRIQAAAALVFEGWNSEEITKFLDANEPGKKNEQNSSKKKQN